MIVKTLNRKYAIDSSGMIRLGCGIIYNAVADCKIYENVRKRISKMQDRSQRIALRAYKIRAETSVRFIMSKDLSMIINVFQLNLSPTYIRRKTKQIMREIRNST